MTPPGTRTTRLLVLLATASMLATSCTDRSREADLPDRAATTGPAAPATTASPAPSSDTEVREAYLTYWKISPQIRKIPNKKLRGFLADYYAEPFLTEQIRVTVYMRVQGIESYGQVVPNIVDITVNGNTAVVTDCQDASSAGITHKKDPAQSQKGAKRRGMTMTLVKGSDGRWRTKKLDEDQKAC